MFLVGGFSESKYLQMRVKEEFGNLVPPIIVPRQPIAAIVRGTCDYGLKMSTIVDRTLKYTYGITRHRDWKIGDPTGPNYKMKKEGNVDRIRIFDCFVTRGTRIEVDQEFSKNYKPHKPAQTAISFPIYITTNLNITEFYDESCMKLLGKLTIDLPDAHLGRSRKVEFSLFLGKWKSLLKQKIYEIEEPIILDLN